MDGWFGRNARIFTASPCLLSLPDRDTHMQSEFVHFPVKEVSALPGPACRSRRRSRIDGEAPTLFSTSPSDESKPEEKLLYDLIFAHVVQGTYKLSNLFVALL